MRRLTIAAFSVCLAAAPLAAVEISTGFLIGPKYDSRAFYVRSGGGAWQKTYSGPEYRRGAQGKLMGVRLGSAPLESDSGLASAEASLAGLRAHGVLLAGVALQGPNLNAYSGAGVPRPEVLGRLDRFLGAARDAGMIVKLVLFHPSQDEQLDGADGILDGARAVTNWLIRKGHRNVILSVATDWSMRGWDHDAFITQRLEQIVDAIRDCFQKLRTDYALPVAISSRVKLAEDSRLVQTADLIMVNGDGRAMDPRKIERPMLVVEEPSDLRDADETSGAVADAAAAFSRTAGWLFVPPDGGDPSAARHEQVIDKISQLVLNKPAAPAGRSAKE